MPQVIISLPTAIFPFFAHLLNVQAPEEDHQAHDVRPRRTHSRQGQRRRQPQPQVQAQPQPQPQTPRHRTTRRTALRQRGQDNINSNDINNNHSQNESIIQEVELTELPDPRTKHQKYLECHTTSLDLSLHLPSPTSPHNTH